jgi:chromosomal replication initiator protein
MNMILQHSELHRQNQLHEMRRQRLWRGKMIAKPQKIEAPIVIDLPEAKMAKTPKPRKEPKLDNMAKILAEHEERIHRLQLDLADAQARILAQAELICTLDSIEISASGPKRSISVIVAEVLADFPGITWADVKGVRRRRDLIRPRHLCMYAVYTERNDLSLPLIGKIFGGKDHSSIHHAVHKIRAEKEREAT